MTSEPTCAEPVAAAAIPHPLDGSRRAKSRLPFLTLVLASGTFLMATSEFVVAGLLPEVAADFGTSVSRAGLAITWFAIGMIVGTPAMVLLTLRLPRRVTLVLALLLFSAGHVVAALSDSFPLLLGARFVTAVATGAFWAVAGLVAADAAGPAARTRALGVVQAGGMLATVIGVPLGALAGQFAGWRAPFWALALLAALAAVVVGRLVPHDQEAHDRPRIRTELAALRSARLWLTLLTCAGVTGGTLSVFSYISPLLTDRTALPAAAVPVALVLFGVAAFAGTLLGGRFGELRPTATVFVAAAVTLAAIVGLGFVSTWPVPTLVVFALLGLTGLSANPVLAALAMRFGGRAPTIASALTPSAFNLGTAVGTGITSAALVGALQETAPVVVGAIGAALVLLAFGTLTWLRRGERLAARS